MNKNIPERESVKVGNEYAQETIMDPLDEEVTKEFISHMYLKPQSLPQPVMQKIAKVLTKFPTTELRTLCNDYMKLYQQLHATERPQDISSIKKPFANTTDLKAERPDMIYHMKKRRTNLDQANQASTDTNDNKDENKETELEKNLEIAKNTNKDLLKSDKILSMITYDKNIALAYMIKKMPETYAHSRRILTELKYRIPHDKPKTFLDFGAGLASGSIAFNDLWPDNDFI